MSEPVTNVEIEDVLSSVKRLVSSGSKAQSAPAPDASETPEQPERFLLTPALRVGGPDDVVESDDDVWTTELADVDEADTTFVIEAALPDADATIESPDRNSLEATIAELEAAVTAQPDEWEPDGSEVSTVPTWETVSYPALEDVEDAIAVDDPIEEENDTGAFGEPFPTVPPEPARSDTFDDEVSHLHAVPDYVPLHAVPELNEDPFAQDAADEDDVADMQGEDVYGDELAPDTPVVAGEDEDIDTYMFGEGASINEEMLRQVVMDIVREELRGKMGERITHNVRKMVRREIHRVINSQDFD